MTIWALIYRISSILLVIIAIIGLVAIFTPQLRKMRELTNKKEQIEEIIRQDEEILKHLRMKQERLLNDPRFVERIAREELGLAKPGETIFRFVDKPASYSTNGR